MAMVQMLRVLREEAVLIDGSCVSAWLQWCKCWSLLPCLLCVQGCMHGMWQWLAEAPSFCY